jgi:hypothetical protein
VIINFSPACPICEVPVSAEVYAHFAEESDIGAETEEDVRYLDQYYGDTVDHWIQHHSHLERQQ